MNLLGLFLACIGAGAAMIGASLFFGDAEADADVEVDADLDADLDAAEVEATAQAGGGVGVSVLPFGSLRFWTFLVEGFGLSGALLNLAGLPDGLTLAMAIAIGSLVGYGAFLLFAWLAREQVSGTTDLADQRNSEGTVLIPIPASGRGKIVVRQASGRVEMLAHTRDGAEIPKGAAVLVVDVRDGVAEVTSLQPGSTSERQGSAADRSAVEATRRLPEKTL